MSYTHHLLVLSFPTRRSSDLFFNDPKDILEAFEPYYGKAELASVSDANVVYDLQRSLNAAGIYHVEEVEGFAQAFFDPKAANARLSYYSPFAKDRVISPSNVVSE